MWPWIIGLIVAAVLLYCVVPNVWIRVLRVGAVWRGPQQPAVALTFDDGPDPKYTGRLLDVLRDAGVNATFFVIGEKALRNPELIERMKREGHEVEVHGYQHVPVPLLSPGAAAGQVERTHHLLSERFGVRTRWYRPPWGLCNLASLFRRGRSSHRLITWTVMVGDWRVMPAQVLLARIMRKIRPGAIIVLHDSDETWGSEPGAPDNVIEMMPDLINAIRSRGYRFVRLCDWWPERR
jgi:peptidoglycan/xylan/chitin deacetylase (PgdA/CDA1 family)